MSRLTCESCGVVYSRAAIIRQMALATGVACRRCGGALQAGMAQTRRGRREPVQAVPAAADGIERMSSGWQSVDDDGGGRGGPR